MSLSQCLSKMTLLPYIQTISFLFKRPSFLRVQEDGIYRHPVAGDATATPSKILKLGLHAVVVVALQENRS